MSKNINYSEKGATLVEVIASFVILVILLVSFFTLFIQTKQTTQSSAQIVDATYIAQTEMEKVYSLGTTTPSQSDAEILITKDIKNGGLGYTKECTGYEDQTNYTLYKNEQKINPDVTVILKLSENKGFPVKLTNAQIMVYMTKGNNKIDNICVNEEDIKQIKKAQMENIIEWKAGS